MKSNAVRCVLTQTYFYDTVYCVNEESRRQYDLSNLQGILIHVELGVCVCV